MKLSKAQMRVLERLAAGETVLFLSDPYALYPSRYIFKENRKTINTKTMDVLFEHELVEPCQAKKKRYRYPGQPDPKFRLSAKGRAFMKGKEPTP